MADKTWKAVERRVAGFFGSTRNALSGGNSKMTRSDSLHKKLFIECKHSKASTLWTLFKKTLPMAKNENKTPVICTHLKGAQGFLITVHSGDLDTLCEEYMISKQ